MDFKKAREIMVDSQIRPNDVSDPEIVSAFLAVPREDFVPPSKRSIAYSELEIPTSGSRALWIARDTAKLIKACEPQSTDIALIIGAGSGYEAAVMSYLADTVIALEDDNERVEALTERLAKLSIDDGVAVEGSLRDGLADQAPFEIIYVCGMVEEVPQAWTDQLAEGGRLAVVEQCDSELGIARIYTKSNETVSPRDIFECCPPKFTAFAKAPSFSF